MTILFGGPPTRPDVISRAKSSPPSAPTYIWQDETEGTPFHFAVRNGSLEHWPLVDSTYANKNINIDYWTIVTSVNSDGDTIELQRYDMLLDYLRWRIKMKTKNNGDLDMRDGFYQSFKEKLNDAIAGYGDARAFWWSIGDVTVDGRSFTNVVLRWNRILDQWSVHSYPSEFTVFSSYVTGGINTVVAGDDNGQVIQLDKADTYTDHDSKPIHFDVVHQQEYFGFNQVKQITESIIVRSEKLNGARVTLLVDGEQSAAGTIDKTVSEVKLTKQIKGNVFQIGVAGTVGGGRGILKEIEIPNVDVTANYV